jgi:hypothetical protein
MSAKSYLKGPEYSEFRWLESGYRIETLNWIGEKGGRIIIEHTNGKIYGNWSYPETEKFILEVSNGNHCIGVQKRADILKELFDSFPSQNGDSDNYEKRFFQKYILACRDRGILLGESDFQNI